MIPLVVHLANLRTNQGLAQLAGHYPPVLAQSCQGQGHWPLALAQAASPRPGAGRLCRRIPPILRVTLPHANSPLFNFRAMRGSPSFSGQCGGFPKIPSTGNAGSQNHAFEVTLPLFQTEGDVRSAFFFGAVWVPENRLFSFRATQVQEKALIPEAT